MLMFYKPGRWTRTISQGEPSRGAQKLPAAQRAWDGGARPWAGAGGQNWPKLDARLTGGSC